MKATEQWFLQCLKLSFSSVLGGLREDYWGLNHGAKYCTIVLLIPSFCRSMAFQNPDDVKRRKLGVKRIMLVQGLSRIVCSVLLCSFWIWKRRNLSRSMYSDGRHFQVQLLLLLGKLVQTFWLKLKVECAWPLIVLKVSLFTMLWNNFCLDNDTGCRKPKSIITLI